jgi:hypothetical protein
MQDGSGKLVVFLVGLIGLIASVIGIYTFLTGNASVVDVFHTSTPSTVEVTPSVSVPPPTPTPTQLPAPIIGVIASYPTERNLQTLSTIWSKNKLFFIDMSTPGTQEYQVDGKATDRLIWNFSWCAAAEGLLDEILAPLSVDFLIDDAVLGGDLLRQYEDIDKGSGDRCKYWATKLTDWEGGKRVKLQIKYYFEEAVNDGRQDYASGQYSQIIWVAVDN